MNNFLFQNCKRVKPRLDGLQFAKVPTVWGFLMGSSFVEPPGRSMTWQGQNRRTRFTDLLLLSLLLLVPSLSATSARAGLFDLETILTASDVLEPGGEFGFSAAISGNKAIIGAPTDLPGSAYLFDVTSGKELIKLFAAGPPVDDQFGGSVGISGNTAIVGAPFDNAEGTNTGSAYLFDVATGSQLFKLTASDTALGSRLGLSAAISGNTAIVGAPFDDDVGFHSGSAYLFDVTTGQELAKLTASDGATGDLFGSSIAINGNTAIVGAASNDDAGDRSGSAYLFDVTTGSQLFKLTASDAEELGKFGVSVAISGNTAIVGSIGTGSAYLFDVATGAELMKLTASGGDPIGASVAIHGNTAMASSRIGSAYLFDVTSGDELTKLIPSDSKVPHINGEFSDTSVAISDNAAIIGAHFKFNENYIASGAAYLFTTPEPSGFLLASLAGLFSLAATHRRRHR